MRDFSWIKKGTRIVFKVETFELWRTGTVKSYGPAGVLVIKDRTVQNNAESIFVGYTKIVGEATDKITPYPFFWHNVLEHLTEEAKENL